MVQAFMVQQNFIAERHQEAIAALSKRLSDLSTASAHKHACRSQALQPPMTLICPEVVPPSRYMLLDFPTYDGKIDPFGLLTSCEKFFGREHFPTVERLPLASFHSPLLWATCLLIDQPEMQIAIFTSGHRDRLRLNVEFEAPSDSVTTMSLVRLFDCLLPLANETYFLTDSGTSQCRTECRPTPPVRRLSHADMMEQRTHGFWYNYDEQYTLGHKCKLFLCLHVEDFDDEDGEEKKKEEEKGEEKKKKKKEEENKKKKQEEEKKKKEEEEEEEEEEEKKEEEGEEKKQEKKQEKKKKKQQHEYLRDRRNRERNASGVGSGTPAGSGAERRRVSETRFCAFPGVSRIRYAFESIHHYLLFDFPGQVELFFLHPTAKNVIWKLIKELDIRLTAIHLVDAHLCCDPGKYVSALLLSLTTMLHLELPHINVLSKIDLIESYGKLAYNLDFYTDVEELSYLQYHLDQDPRSSKYSLSTTSTPQADDNLSLPPLFTLDVNSAAELCRCRNSSSTILQRLPAPFPISAAGGTGVPAIRCLYSQIFGLHQPRQAEASSLPSSEASSLPSSGHLTPPVAGCCRLQ
ncbi:hypothetical protein KSP39_PZI014516 [Platanthera zijinensis]|uniref:GPN-loop GTPase 2 n=1 Tax=Platanthera zijinensis TaxID=2320716 RepID=A0AAP0BBJ6_9ASPA